ncbi:hypothetical protein [Yersinia artesiana]|uniref:hypothetical protein n=1 Tax=Yersinia artesiana TaxID=2890315 RepID=UPI001581A845|nr:hypothetical protein [Yersinia artesiana]
MENIIARFLINITILTMLYQSSVRENVLRKIFTGEKVIIGISWSGQKQKQPHKETVFATLSAHYHS